MPLDGDYEPSTAGWARRHAERYEATNGEEAGELRGRPIIVLTSVGAKTGKLRKTALMRVEHEGVYAVVASLGGAATHPVWYYNLRQNPHVELHGSERSRPGPTTPSTKRRPTVRSRCSCSNPWMRPRFHQRDRT
jgi:deazaflavin-dependent oxidoreductase (nitroreductase family)